MKALLFCYFLILVSNGCGKVLDFRERARLDSLIAIYDNKPVHILVTKDVINYAYIDSTRLDTAFGLRAGKFYRLQQKDGYPDNNGQVLIVLTEGCIWQEGYVHYSQIRELLSRK